MSTWQSSLCKFNDCDDEISDITTREDVSTDDGDKRDNKVDNTLEDPFFGVLCPAHQLAWQLHQQNISLFTKLSPFLAESREIRDYEDDLRKT